MDKLDLKRSLEREIKRCRIEGRDEANETIGASSQRRSRCSVAYEYGPPLFQIGDMEKIMKDTTRGVRGSWVGLGGCNWKE